jgi:hypothetical protein
MNTVSVNTFQSNLSGIELFNLSKELFENYTTLQMKNELTYSLMSTVEKYQFTIENLDNPRQVYNDLINRYYHNEITIKSNFIKSVILKTKNHVTIFELNSGDSRADLCKFNGVSIAYEIKTDLDNLVRLNKQVEDYMAIFEKVYVICSRKNLEKIKDIIPKECGLYSYRFSKNCNYIFKLEKNALKSKKINCYKQIQLLTKKQLCDITDLSNSLQREKLEEAVIKKYSPKKINSMFKLLIKAKYSKQWDFLKANYNDIYEIDYQWFFKNNVNPNIIYK